MEADAMCGYWIMSRRNCQLLKRFRCMNCVRWSRRRIRPSRCTVRSLVIELAAQGFVATAPRDCFPTPSGSANCTYRRSGYKRRVRAYPCRCPNFQAHWSALSLPEESYQAFRSGSVTASEASCIMIEAIPSAPLPPRVCISQADGQRSGFPTNANLMSVPPIVLLVCQPQ